MVNTREASWNTCIIHEFRAKMEYGGIRPYSMEYGRAVTFHGPLHSACVDGDDRDPRAVCMNGAPRRMHGPRLAPCVRSTPAPRAWTALRTYPALCIGPPAALVGGASCAGAARQAGRLRLGGRAQLVGVRPDQDDGAGAHGPRRGRQACVLPRAPPPEDRASSRRLATSRSREVGLGLGLGPEPRPTRRASTS